MTADKKPGGLRKPMIWILLLLAVCAAVYAAFQLIGMQKEADKQIEAQDTLREAVTSTASPAPTADKNESEDAPEQARQLDWPDVYARQPDKTIDFEALRAINEDVAAWITVPGTAIDYPVVFAVKGDELYLEHDLERNKSEHGAIYFDGYNSPDFSDTMMVLYGHNMEDGSMFAALHNFESSTFWEENQRIYVYIDDYMLEYAIIAAYQTDDTHILATHDFANANVLDEYVEGVYAIRDLSAKLRPYKFLAGDRLITLATCVQGQDDARYLVMGALTKNE